MSFNMSEEEIKDATIRFSNITVHLSLEELNKIISSMSIFSQKFGPMDEDFNQLLKKLEIILNKHMLEIATFLQDN